jgi:hypothetical protein
MKRKFTGAPVWVDYTVQLVCWWDNILADLHHALVPSVWDWLDNHCKCERCEERRTKGLQK